MFFIFILPLVSVFCSDSPELDGSKWRRNKERVFTLSSQAAKPEILSKANLARGFWRRSQRPAVSIRTSTEGREVSAMHKDSGDVIEKLLSQKMSLKVEWPGTLLYAKGQKRLFLSALSFLDDLYCRQGSLMFQILSEWCWIGLCFVTEFLSDLEQVT